MSTLFSVPLDDSGRAEIVFAAPSVGGPAAYGAAEDVVRRSADTLAAAMGMIRSVGQCAIDTLSGLDLESAEASVGLKLTATGNFVIAEAGAEATLNVKFVLKKKPATP